MEHCCAATLKRRILNRFHSFPGIFKPGFSAFCAVVSCTSEIYDRAFGMAHALLVSHPHMSCPIESPLGYLFNRIERATYPIGIRMGNEAVLCVCRVSQFTTLAQQ